MQLAVNRQGVLTASCTTNGPGPVWNKFVNPDILTANSWTPATQNQVTSRRRSVVTVRWSAETSGTFTPSSQDQPLYFVVTEINHDLD